MNQSFSASFSKPSHLLGSTGALLHPTGVGTPSTRGFIQQSQRPAPQKENLEFLSNLSLNWGRLRNPLYIWYIYTRWWVKSKVLSWKDKGKRSSKVFPCFPECYTVSPFSSLHSKSVFFFLTFFCKKERDATIETKPVERTRICKSIHSVKKTLRYIFSVLSKYWFFSKNMRRKFRFKIVSRKGKVTNWCCEKKNKGNSLSGFRKKQNSAIPLFPVLKFVAFLLTWAFSKTTRHHAKRFYEKGAFELQQIAWAH